VPDQPTWLHRVPAIRAALQLPSAPPILDRAAIERLFALRRRQAIRLLAMCGGYQVGRTFVVPKQALLDYLDTRVGAARVEFAVRRKDRIIDQINAERRQAASTRVTLQVARPVYDPSLPEGVQLLPGLLQVRFRNPVELLEKLFALAQTVSNDFEAFERAAQLSSDT